MAARPSKPRALLQAKSLWAQRRYDEALRKFNQAVREAPNDVETLVAAGRAFAFRYEWGRARGLLSRALRLAPRRADVQHVVGESYRLLDDGSKAEGCFRQACRLAAMPQSQLALAQMLERRHALVDALEFVNRALRTQPQSGAALLLRARIERRRGDVDKSSLCLRQLASDLRCPSTLRAEAFGEFCLLMDSIGEYDDAWRAILSCKQILLDHSDAAWKTAQFVCARCRRMVDALTPEHFQRWRKEAPSGSTHRMALLAGFPRAGTTLLQQMLNAHPQIVISEEKEVFSADIFPRLSECHPPDAPIEQVLDELNVMQIASARNAYLTAIEDMVGEPIGTRLHVDKNPAMNLMIPAMRRIFPELKLIVALRDPRDVVVSCFLRYLPVNPVSVCFLTLERTVERFALDMGAWLKMRNMVDHWTEVHYERVVTDLRDEAYRLVEFLSLPWDEAVLQYREGSENKMVRSPSYEDVARPIFTTAIGRWRNYEKHLSPVLDQLAPLAKALGYNH